MPKPSGGDGHPSESIPASALLPLSSSVVIGHLKACQDICRDNLDKSFRLFMRNYVDAIDLEIDRAESNTDSTELLTIQRELKKKANELKQYYVGCFLEGFVKFSKKKLLTSIESGGSSELKEEDFSILENDALEESIAISSITQRVETYYAEPIWALNQRFAILNKSEPVTEASNPVSPLQFCDALRRSLALVTLNSRTKLIAYKVFDFQLMDLFRVISEDVNDYLRSQGILPSLRFSVPKGIAPKSYLSEDGDSFGRRAEDRILLEPGQDPDQPSEQYQADLLTAIRGLHAQMSLNTQASSGPAPVTNYTPQELVGALNNLQHAMEVQTVLGTPGAQLTPVDISGLVEQLKNKLAADTDSEDVKRDDMQTIELVGLVFEYMLNDENIPDAVKTVLSYLHTPFLKIAFIDPDFFESGDHPARLLLNTLADAGARWVNNDGDSELDVFEKIKATVKQLVDEFDNDVKIVTSLLFEFKSHIKHYIRKQELTEKRAKEKAQGEDKLREMKLRVNDAIRERINDRELPSAVLLLLLQPWSDYLTLILLRHGDSSDRWSDGIAVVDDVLWCIQSKTLESEKQLLTERSAEVCQALKAGFTEIGFDNDNGIKLIDSFQSLCELALEEKEVEPAPEPMRNELERIADENAGKLSADANVSAEESQMVESLKMIEFGTWFEFDDGKRLKVAWYNGRTSHYMLVDQMGKRADMKSGLDLARKMIAGEAKIISGSSKPFFERALENIYQKLNEQADLA